MLLNQCEASMHQEEIGALMHFWVIDTLVCIVIEEHVHLNQCGALMHHGQSVASMSFLHVAASMHLYPWNISAFNIKVHK